MKIMIERAAIADGEDLMDFANKLHRAVVKNASQFGAEPGNIYLAAGYRDYVVVRDYAKERYIKASYKRKSDTDFTFSKFMVVRKAWEEVKSLEEADGVNRESDEKNAFEELDVVVKRGEESKWSGIL